MVWEDACSEEVDWGRTLGVGAGYILSMRLRRRDHDVIVKAS